MPPTKAELLNQVAGIIADYRADDREVDFTIPEPNSAHVERWIDQFDEGVRLPILEEMAHILELTYLPKVTAIDHFRSFAASNQENVKSYNFIQNQTLGSSQGDLIDLLDERLDSICDCHIEGCGSEGGLFVYIDDYVFAGGHIKQDLASWITNDAPDKAVVCIVLFGYYLLAQYSVGKELASVIEESGKEITLRWYGSQFENRKYYKNISDVLWPKADPDYEGVDEFIASITTKYSPVYREGDSVGRKSFFSSPARRDLVEQEFYKKGLYIKSQCQNLDEYMRPLGRSMMSTHGFGALNVTYRNCPNNSPLALWVGAPWYPLFPRKINA